MKCGVDHPPVYKLLSVLHDEAKLVVLTSKLITSSNVAMHRRKKTQDCQALICNLWDEYDDGILTKSDLLEKVSAFVAF